MSNYDGPSKTLDDLRGLIIRDSGLAPLDITMLGRVEARLEYVEMALRSEQAKHRVRDTRKGEWPDEGQRMQVWDECEWSPWIHVDDAEGFDGRYWLPAPPPPEES